MKVSVNWLRQFVDFDETPGQIAERITFGAFELDGMENISRPLSDLVVGKIVETKPHPDADKLKLTKVDVGGEILDIICGAPNCREGILAPVAKPGARLGDFTIEPKKLRGVTSYGMILSEKEMGLTDDHSGVMELESGIFKPGDGLENLAPLEDTILDFEITVNRPDALSHLGIAREIAAYLRKPLVLPSFDVKETGPDVNERVKVEILSPEQCPRYTARMVTDVKVKKSPLWMRVMLSSLGQRPINNVVDITNYVLFELGHPLHAFDYNLVKDGHIVVRLAADGEKLTTLDDKERTLNSNDLLIADVEKGVGLGGVMGGANSEVDDSTSEILIEAAHFEAVGVRKTAKKLGLSTEASRRFERGADPEMAPLASARTAELIRELGEGTVLTGVVDSYPKPIEKRSVSMRPSRASTLLGMDIKPEFAKEAFEALQLEVAEEGEDSLTVSVPTFRPDLEREVDLIEEVVRIVGYDKVPTATESRVVLGTRQDPLDALMETAVDVLVGMGFREALNSGMAPGKDHELFKGGLKPFGIEKPISPEMNVYRASLVPSLLRTIQHNLNVGAENARFVEVGQLGGPSWLGVDGKQRHHLAFALTGDTQPPSYDGSSQQIDLPYIKGVISALSNGLSLDKSPKFEYDTASNLRQGLVLRDESGNVVLQAGLLSEDVADGFDIERPVFVCEVDLERWVKLDRDGIHRPGAPNGYKPFSRFPANIRDIALIVPFQVTAETLMDAIRKAGGELLDDVSLFDLYQGKPLGADERSLAFHLEFRAMDRTLTDTDVDPVYEKILKAVISIEGVRQR